ncbi:MAG: aldehyde dehydrogenase family protein [Planctomycetota bacterium]|nr:aldehyde dehydrogenase family protein [Planctomycetota bacterium]
MQPLFLGGFSAAPDDARPIEVVDKVSGSLIATVACASGATIERALDGAAGARSAMAALSPPERAAILDRAADRLEDRRGELAELIVGEAGKPIAAARAEVERCLATFRLSAAEALRLCDEALPIQYGDQARGRVALRRRFPVGVASFITPFNFPLNLVAHKVAPAIAAGCPFLLKPASLTPLSALAIGEALAGAGLPAGAFSVLPARGADAEVLATDPRVAKLSFTGSDAVGWRLHALAGRKRCTLELGGNAAVIVDETAHVERAASAIVRGAFGQAGQSCISVQRVIATSAAHAALKSALIGFAREVRAGDPREEGVLVGPMITEREAERVEAWIAEAVEGGARVLVGGGRDGALVEPTLLEGVPAGARILDEEAFGPVAVLAEVPDFEAALREANRTRFGLQAGVFTRDLGRAHRAWDALEVGGVIVGDVPTWRADAMPYGGIKDSGIGREGPIHAIDALCEWRLMVVDPS